MMISLKTPTTFAEAAGTAEIRMKERELSTLPSSLPTPLNLLLRKIIPEELQTPAPSTDSSGSSVAHSQLSPCYTIPATVSPMSPIEVTIENEITGKLLALTVD